MALRKKSSSLPLASPNIVHWRVSDPFNNAQGVVRNICPPKGRRKYITHRIARKSQGGANTLATPATCGSAPSITRVKETSWGARVA
jgi:hypothetical protein